jgi:hypothetical protein
LRDIAAEIGVSPESVRRWTTSARGRRRKATIVPVQVCPDAEPERGVVIVTPSGLRLEGLDVERAADLVRRLG